MAAERLASTGRSTQHAARPYRAEDQREGTARWGETLTLTGRGFEAGDTVEFADADHAVRVAPERTAAKELHVRVPDGMGPGYVRIWRGRLRSNIVPINLYPRERKD